MSLIRMEVYEQSVKIITTDAYAVRCVKEFCRSMIRYRTDTVVDTSRPGYHVTHVRVPDCTYAAAPVSQAFFCVHRGQLNEIVSYFNRCGIVPSDIETVIAPNYEPAPATLVVKDIWTDRDYQVPIINYILEDGALKILPVQTGKGKATTLSTKLRVPGGWTTMGETYVGQTLIGRSGQQITVTGVHPQPVKKTYKLTTIDGRIGTVCGEHLWEFRTEHGEWTVDDTIVIRELLEEGRVYLPLALPEQQTDNPVVAECLRLGCLSQPDPSWLESSIEQRIELLRRFAAGGIPQPTHHQMAVTPTDSETIPFIQSLVWSLGGIAKRDTNSVYIQLPILRAVFPKCGFVDTPLYLEIKSIEDDVDQLTQCITVDASDALYLIDDYLVTHNTYMALKAASLMGQRVMLVTRGGYIDKWIEDVKKTYDIDENRILVVKGCKALIRAIQKAQEGDFDYDVVMVSTGGYSDYIKQYEQFLGTELGESYLDPRAIAMLFKIGLRIVDESHQMLHAYYKIDLYSHYNKVLFLSATILANDALEKRIHDIIYPAAKRYIGAEWTRYITATALRYNLAEPHKVRYKDHRKNYSHVVYEQYLMRNKKELSNYLKMVGGLAKDFFDNRSPGQKYLIFASTVEMCDTMVADLRKRLPELIVGRYTAEDKLEDIYGYDLIVTTPGSGGTGIDIPDLAKALATCAISSSKLNVQMLGRLRELKNYPGEEPEYQYLVCYDIPKNVEYHKQKLELFHDKVKHHREQSTGAVV